MHAAITPTSQSTQATQAAQSFAGDPARTAALDELLDGTDYYDDDLTPEQAYEAYREDRRAVAAARRRGD